MMMRKLCPNVNKEGGLDTVLEVPIPEEMFDKMGATADVRWQNMRNLMRAHYQSAADKWAAITNPLLSDNDHFLLLLKLVGSAFIPFPFRAHLDDLNKPIKDGSIESCTAKYIVQQYLAAAGGLAALNAVSSMYAVGQVKMVVAATDGVKDIESVKKNSEAGGFVLWQMSPDLWYLELVVSRHKISAGSDGNITWTQSSSNSNTTRGPPRPLRRFFQGLDPRSTANLFSNTVCIGEKVINEEDCFILKLETSADVLKAQNTAHTELVHHTIWGYFSQRSGLLVQFEDTKLIRMKTSGGAADDDSVFYETSLVSWLDDYRLVNGVNIAHGGKTTASIYRYGKTLKRRWKLEESWSIEEVDFNIEGLSVDYFLPPAEDEIKKEDDDGDMPPAEVQINKEDDDDDDDSNCENGNESGI